MRNDQECDACPTQILLYLRRINQKVLASYERTTTSGVAAAMNAVTVENASVRTGDASAVAAVVAQGDASAHIGDAPQKKKQKRGKAKSKLIHCLVS